ncbi:hypothetical protein KUC_3916 [Vreelandella boliviensis LC1]|uniref:Uncharacterized protein n=1 Tax=Vreelandella boliviensis LC1 TaxID=1072583 RepID=A0A7U9BZW9_9GAMM|nr:hypothetical protein KUC_3916 [Halomonas boliviensis LC1]
MATPAFERNAPTLQLSDHSSFPKAHLPEVCLCRLDQRG